MEQKKNIMDYDTVSLDDESSAVVIIDQTNYREQQKSSH